MITNNKNLPSDSKIEVSAVLKYSLTEYALSVIENKSINQQ